MIVTVLLIIAGLAAALGFGWIGYLLGWNAGHTNERLVALEERREAEDDDSSAIVDTSPKRLRERHEWKPGASAVPDIDDDDSGIVHVKSPQQMKADKERREKAELDKITGSGLR